ncbi:unnamed protein product [Lactuca saligna]|uniref:Uncharacterized protein n=1 Tax=Lactuca saligna TaxID=75948 RepID=A0AA36EJH2_LACSI|nr:unnamed protein product [Lactuca saligna]
MQSSRRRQLLPSPTFLLVLAPPTFDLRLAAPHRPTLSSVTQLMEPLISGNLTSPALSSNIRSGDLRVKSSVLAIFLPSLVLPESLVGRRSRFTLANADTAVSAASMEDDVLANLIRGFTSPSTI